MFFIRIITRRQAIRLIINLNLFESRRIECARRRHCLPIHRERTRHILIEAAGPDLRVWDTRKTTPGMRVLEKAA